MRKSEVLRNIELLREVKPRKEWAAKTRELLLSQIQAQEVYQKSPVFSFEKAACYIKDGLVQSQQVMVRAFFSRRVGGFVTLGVLLVGTAFASVLSQNSLPGEPLYAVKRTGESVRVAVTSSDEKPHLALELVEERFKELDLVSRAHLSDEEKSQKTSDIVKNVSEGVTDASHNLSVIKLSQESKKVASVASLITEKARKYHTSLQKVDQENGVSSPIHQEVQDALKKVDQAQHKALEVLVDKKDAVGEKAVTEEFNGQVKDIEDTLAHLFQRVTIAASDTPESQAALQKSDEATQKLSQVKESILKKDFKIALTQLNQSKELASQAQAAFVKKNQKEGDTNVHIQSEGQDSEKTKKDTVSF